MELHAPAMWVFVLSVVIAVIAVVGALRLFRTSPRMHFGLPSLPMSYLRSATWQKCRTRRHMPSSTVRNCGVS